MTPEMQQISDLTFSGIGFLVLTCFLLFLLPLIFIIYWRKVCGKQASFAYLLAGAAGFFVTVRILELGVHIFCIVLDTPISRAINGNLFLFVLYGISMAGIFEECGRYVILRYLMRKNKTYENAVMYGIGHGGIEVWVILLPSTILSLVCAILFQTNGASAAMTALHIDENSAQAALPVLQAAASFGFSSMFVTVLERIFAMILHISLTVIVYTGVRTGKKKFLLLAILFHMLADLLPAVTQKHPLPVLFTEGWLFVITIGIFIYSRSCKNRFL